MADANRVHDWRIYADFAQVLIRRARKLYAQEPLAVDLAQTVYALDIYTSPAGEQQSVTGEVSQSPPAKTLPILPTLG